MEKNNSTQLATEETIVLSNTCEGLKPGSMLAKIAENLSDDCQITLSKAEHKKLLQYMRRLEHGFSASVPLTCAGSHCKFVNKCPLEGHWPIARECPIEAALFDTWKRDYIRDMGIDETNRVDMALIGDVVFWEILEKRASEELSENPEIIRQHAIGMQRDGKDYKPIYSEQLNPIIHFFEKAQKQKLKLMNALLATREAKAKDITRTYADPSTHAAKLMEKFRVLQEQTAIVTDAKIVEDTDESAEDA